MGTTLVGLELDEDNGRAWTVHVGDSRCYRFRRDRLQMLTADHSYVDEQVRRGEITEEEAAVSPLRNVITRAVGSQPDVDVDVAVHATEPGDLFLLCSDGLNRELLDDEIEGILRGCSRDLQECARTLVQVANEHGGGDNITVVLLRLSPPAVRR
jgi:protein phosphatase